MFAKPAFLFAALVGMASALAGCSTTLSREQRASYQQPGVSPPVAARIQRGARLSMADVVNLSQSGMRSGEIIVYLADSGSDFNITPDDAANLRREGVSGDVISYLRDRPNDTGGMLNAMFSY